MRITETSDVWWKNAVVYCVEVESFFDSDGDGVGDFAGLAKRIDYLEELGITCLWLMPVYPTGGVDDGYDVTDFFGIDPRLGSHGSFVELIRMASSRGIRVILDLVVNHSSDQHPWFREAKRDRKSPLRPYYVWVDEPPDLGVKPVFPDKESSVWQLEPTTGQYYLHHFYKQQPDLNVGHPQVRDEIAKVMGFWLQLGVSGFRIDAVPFLFETLGLPSSGADSLPDPHDFLRDLRAFVSRRSGDAILLGEVNVPHDEQAKFFGDSYNGDELTMQFDFIAMQYLYLSLARSDAGPLAQALVHRPVLPRDAQWATFVRNHDELTLDKLTDEERQEVFAAFGPDPEMQLYGRGLRRRLPPMLDGDPRRIRLVYSLLFSLPGTPVLFYGEEIGMGENLDLPDRRAVRTPMQWSGSLNGGFSTAEPSELVCQPPDGGFSPTHVNVEDQRHDPDSLLRFMTTLIRRYRQSPELAWGIFSVLEQPFASVMAHRCTWDDGSIVCLHNLGAEPRVVPLTLDDCSTDTRLVDLLADAETRPDEKGRVELSLDGYGYRWIRVAHPGDRRLL